MQNRGYKIVATGFRLGRWQADILAYDHKVPVVVEVKAGIAPSRPEANLSEKQSKRLFLLGKRFFKGSKRPVRLDLVTVRFKSLQDPAPEIDLFKDIRILQ